MRTPAQNVVSWPKVLGDVLYERDRQDKKWGEQNHTIEKWMLILQEEVGEAAQERLDSPDNTMKFYGEMVQVAAVALAILECLERARRFK